MAQRRAWCQQLALKSELAGSFLDTTTSCGWGGMRNTITMQAETLDMNRCLKDLKSLPVDMDGAFT